MLRNVKYEMLLNECRRKNKKSPADNSASDLFKEFYIMNNFEKIKQSEENIKILIENYLIKE